MDTNVQGSADKAAQAVRRSERREVRNPILALPAAKRIEALPADAKAALRAILLEMREDARERAQKCWKAHKGAPALYWKCVAVYTGHIARVLLPRSAA